MALYNFGTEDIIIFALYQRQLHGEKNPKVTFEQVERYKKHICKDLADYSVSYSIFEGSSRTTNSSNNAILNNELSIKVKKDYQNQVYTFDGSYKTSLIRNRILYFIPTYIHAFLTPDGFENDLGIDDLKHEDQPGD